MDQMAKGISGIDHFRRLHVLESENEFRDDEVHVGDKCVVIGNMYFPYPFWNSIGVCREKDLLLFKETTKMLAKS